MKTAHIIAKNYDGLTGGFRIFYRCPCCNKEHSTTNPLQGGKDVNFVEQTCRDMHIVIWVSFDKTALCASVNCGTCKGTGKEVLFQVPELCSKCKMIKVSLETLENWYLQNV